MAFKPQDEGLTKVMMEAREKEVMDEIDKLIDKKLLFTLAKIIPDNANAATIVSDPDIEAKSKELKALVADVIANQEAVITAIARDKAGKGDDRPVAL